MKTYFLAFSYKLTSHYPSVNYLLWLINVSTMHLISYLGLILLNRISYIYQVERLFVNFGVFLNIIFFHFLTFITYPEASILPCTLFFESIFKNIVELTLYFALSFPSIVVVAKWVASHCPSFISYWFSWTLITKLIVYETVLFSYLFL